MAFFSSIIASITAGIAAVGSWLAANAIVAGIAQTAFAIAASYAVNALFKPKTPSTSAQVETEYGANNPRTVILGTCGLAGRHVYRNNFGSGGREFVDVYELASFRISGVPRVKYNGQWRTLSSPDGNGWYAVPNEGSSGESYDNVRVKFYFGSMSQQADPYLITTSRPSGRWTANHRGAGVAYAIVYSQLQRKGRGLTSPAQLLFEVKGAPLYDWRKDSSVGGSGSHRWNDQSTWEYNENPVVQAYNLERGFFNGAQKMVGKGVRASRLPLSEWTQAANICDEIIDGFYRYRSHMIAKDGPGGNHDANLQPLLEAICASWVERVDGEFPIVGAPQAIVATITDDDLKVGASKRFTAKRKRTELINTVAASYISPDDFYATKDAATRIDQSALAEDRETLASAIPYGAVTYVKQVDRLADIALRGARFQGSAEITIHPRFLDVVKEGRWITWASVKHGTRTYQVLSRTLGPHNSDGVRDITVSLQEISNGVFDPTAYATNPPVIIVVPPPDYLAEVQNFIATPNVVEADGGGLLPGVRLSWDAIEDISVSGVLVEYWPIANPTQVFTKTVEPDISVVQIVEGLTSETDWRVRTTLLVDNGRSVAPSAATAFRTLQAGGDFVADLEHLGKDTKAVFTQIGGELDDLWKRLEEATTAFTLDGAVGQVDRQKMRAELGAARAEIVEEKRVRVSESEALAETLTALSASFGENFAEGLVSFKAVASPTDVLVRFAIMLRAGTDEDFTESGFYIQIRTVGGIRVSEVGFLADKFTILTEDGALPVFATEGGAVKIINAMIQQAQIENLFVNGNQIEPGAAGFIKALKVPSTTGGTYDFVVKHGLNTEGTHHELRFEIKLTLSRGGTGSTSGIAWNVYEVESGPSAGSVFSGVYSVSGGQSIPITTFAYSSLAETQTKTQTTYRLEVGASPSISWSNIQLGAILTKNVPNNI